MLKFTPINIELRKSCKTFNGGGRPRVAPIVRFMAKVRKTKTCWIWVASTGRGGYGQFDDGNHTISAHRFSYTYFVGKIPTNKNVLHICDNAVCVNPQHLEIGDALKNQRDKWKRGRGIRLIGKLNGCYRKPAWNRGKSWGKSVRDKISKATTGRIPWNKGIPGRPGISYKGKHDAPSRRT